MLVTGYDGIDSVRESIAGESEMFVPISSPEKALF